MNTYYYVHTGHRVGLDRFRRAAAVIEGLNDEDITLLTSDFRIASEAKAYGFRRAVGVDVVQNIAHIAKRGDRLIFDSDEHNPTTLDDMMHFFSTVIRFSDNSSEVKHEKEFLVSPYLEGEGICKATPVASKYFGTFEKSIEVALFYGDDDYEKEVIAHQDTLKALNMELLLGFYYFVYYEDEVVDSFKKIHENEAYDEVIQQSKILITSSQQAVLDSLAAGGRPIFIQREDHSDEFQELFKKLSIPVIEGLNMLKLTDAVATAKQNTYGIIEKKGNQTTHFIKEILNS